LFYCFQQPPSELPQSDPDEKWLVALDPNTADECLLFERFNEIDELSRPKVAIKHKQQNAIIPIG